MKKILAIVAVVLCSISTVILVCKLRCRQRLDLPSTKDYGVHPFDSVDQEDSKATRYYNDSGGHFPSLQNRNPLKLLMRGMTLPAPIHDSVEMRRYPRFPKRSRDPDFVSSVKPLSDGLAAKFKEEFIQRTKSNWRECTMTAKKKRDLLYARFDWASTNLNTLVNMMRVSGIKDEAINHMFHGLPLCWPNQTLFDSFREELTFVARSLKQTVGFTNVRFVHSGSCVSGFSQNPHKGLLTQPSWISDPRKSDVDIIIIADGVDDFVRQHKEQFTEFDGIIDRSNSKLRFSVAMIPVVDGDGITNNGGTDNSDYGQIEDNDHYGCAYDDLMGPSIGSMQPTHSIHNKEENGNILYSCCYDNMVKQEKNPFRDYVRIYEVFGDAFAEFWRKWENVLDKSIQFLVSEGQIHIPEWEIDLNAE